MQDVIKEDESFALSDSDIQNIEEDIENGDEEAVEEAISNLNATDCAELLGKVSEDNRQVILEQHGSAIVPDAYAELDPELCKDALEDMEAPQVAALISSMDSDDALDVIDNLDPDFQKEVSDLQQNELAKEQDAATAFQDAVKSAVAKVGKKEGYDMVFNSQAVPYSKTKYDLSHDVIALMKKSS